MDELEVKERVHEPTHPGQPFPVITQEMVAAGGRLDVLQHQPEELRGRRTGLGF